MSNHKTSKKAVIAIDFGTAYTGFAFAWLSKSETRGYTNPAFYLNWPGQPIEYYKTRTLLLYNPQGDLEAFGWDVYHRMLELREETDENMRNGFARDYQYFDGLDIKIKLYSEDEFDYNTEFHTFKNNQSLLVVDLIKAVLENIKIQATEHLNKTNSSLFDKERDIQWCITVPAPGIIKEGNKKQNNKSHDLAKHIMRQAAEKAGLINSKIDNGNTLEFVLEPEAAAITCIKKDREATFSKMKVGTCFLVIDAGGGTVDVIAYKVAQGTGINQELLETAARGVADTCGSIYVNQKFQHYLENLFTEDIFNTIRDSSALLDILISWEREKSFYDKQKFNNKKPIRIPIPASLTQTRSWERIKQRLSNEQAGRSTEIYLDYKTIENLFQESIDKTLKVIKEQFQILKSKNINCEYIYLVGGFAKSMLLQASIQEFADKNQVKKVIIPEEPGGSVLWGGVCYGFNKNTLRSRYSSLTYGIAIRMDFREGIDPESKRFKCPHRGMRCENRFDILVVAGDVIEVGHKVVKTYSPSYPEQENMSLSLYTTHKITPEYIDEDGVSYAGATIPVKMPNTKRGMNREVKVTIVFGNVEIEIEAEDLETHQVTKGKLKFDFDYLDR